MPCGYVPGSRLNQEVRGRGRQVEGRGGDQQAVCFEVCIFFFTLVRVSSCRVSVVSRARGSFCSLVPHDPCLCEVHAAVISRCALCGVRIFWRVLCLRRG